MFLTSGLRTDVISPRAGGAYSLSSSAEPRLRELSPEDKTRLTTWLVDQRRAGDPSPLISSEALRDIGQRRLLKVSEKRRRFFLLLSELGFGPEDYISVAPGTPRGDFWRNVLAAQIEEENSFQFLELLRGADLLRRESEARIFYMTAKGFDELEAIETGRSKGRQGFVAMWFDDSMADAYDHGFAKAIEDCGYNPLRIDRKEHNNKIDDEIVAEIRRSNFVVADFTCGHLKHDGKQIGLARGGVYFEAGFAMGLGIPVFWTCRKSSVDHLHFDTRQFAHVTWEAPDDLRLALTRRIQATLG